LWSPECYGPSVPPAAFGRRLACPSPHWRRGRDSPEVVPWSPSSCRRIEAWPSPCCPLKGYAADIHRGLQVGLRSRRRSLPRRKFDAPPLPTTRPAGWSCSTLDGLKHWSTLVTPLCLCSPGPGRLAVPTRPCRCQGCFPRSEHLLGNGAPSFAGLLRQPGGVGLSSVSDHMAPDVARAPRRTDRKRAQCAQGVRESAPEAHGESIATTLTTSSQSRSRAEHHRRRSVARLPSTIATSSGSSRSARPAIDGAVLPRGREKTTSRRCRGLGRASLRQGRPRVECRCPMTAPIMNSQEHGVQTRRAVLEEADLELLLASDSASPQHSSAVGT